MGEPDDYDVLEELVSLRKQIRDQEFAVRRARLNVRLVAGLLTTSLVLFGGMWVVTAFLGSGTDLGPYWALVMILIGATAIPAAVVAGRNVDKDLLNRRGQQAKLDELHDMLDLQFSGEQLELGVRQHAFRGTMLRAIAGTRKRGDRYRSVNNVFQTVIIVGSLSTTTVASLNPDQGPMKWIAIVLSFIVGVAAGLTGYFKYRDRAFYLRQSADDIEAELSAYELGIAPYHLGSDDERLQKLTERVEALRIAQQQREQQLDQPKSSRDES